MSNDNDMNIETILNNPADAKTLKGFIDEAILCKMRIKAENESVKDIRDEAKDKLGIKGKLFNLIVKAEMSDDLEGAKSDIEDAETVIEKLYRN